MSFDASTDDPRPLAISLGDPAGIGPEVVAKCWDQRGAFNLPHFLAIGDPTSLKKVWDGPIAQIDDPAEAENAFDVGLPLLALRGSEEPVPGCPTLSGAHVALDSLELAVGLARSGSAKAVVTGPVSKAQLYKIGFSYPGQTEFVAERCGVSGNNAAMMLAGPTLRTVPLTIHMSLAEAVLAVTPERVEARARTIIRGLKRNFGLSEPRLAVAGLNPHAGEQGQMGRQDDEIIRPVIEKLRSEGHKVIGPMPSDTMFHEAARANYDAALCMYHDQALIPIKAIHFSDAVNLTLGLPIVRASPDHGTAFDIAGNGTADPRPMAAAIRMASECAAARRAQKL